MKTPWFTSLENFNWTRLWWTTGIVAVFWTGLVTILPMDIYKIVAVPLNALQTALLFAARGTKYVQTRTQPPQNGKV